VKGSAYRKSLGTALAAAAGAVFLVALPASAASPDQRKARGSILRSSGFTPAVADPRLAADFARRGVSGNAYRFTPSDTRRSSAVRVAVRARTTNPGAARRASDASDAVTALTPMAYNLGVAVGWRRFAVSGDVARLRSGPLPGGREAAEVGVSYAGNRFVGRLEVGADRPDAAAIAAPSRTPGEEAGYTVGVGGSYRIARNLDVTGGLRYRRPDERLQPSNDGRRDSQAVYIGTAFRF